MNELLREVLEAHGGLNRWNDTGMSITLPRIVGYAKAPELLAFAEPIDAARADAYGLCTKVVSEDSCLAEAQVLAKSLATGSAFACAA